MQIVASLTQFGIFLAEKLPKSLPQDARKLLCQEPALLLVRSLGNLRTFQFSRCVRVAQFFGKLRKIST